MENPLQTFVGTTQQLDILRLNDDGEGVAKLGDVTVFVPGALPGESVSARIASAQRRYLVATVKDRHNNPSSIRTRPLCPVFDECGGCQMQHMAYSGQLRHKQDVVEGALRRIGKFTDTVVLPTMGMENPWRYRNQIQVPLSYDEKTGKLTQGFFSAGSHSIVETSSCLLVPEAVEQTMLTVPEQISATLKSDAKMVHHLIIRHSVHTGEQMVVLCVRNRPGSLGKLAKELLGGTVVSVAVTVQSRPTGPVWGDTVEVIAGQETITERLGEVDFLVSPRSFFQVNTRQAERLTQLVRERAALSGDETVLDAYCGTGTFSLTLARSVKQTVGVESVAPAIADARKNAEKNGMKNATFEVGTVEAVLPKWVRKGRHFDVAVLDPPRKGCHPDVLAALADARIPRIIYVSCNPSTLARDARVLADNGYGYDSFQPVDMFPHTSHVECVVLFTRKQ